MSRVELVKQICLHTFVVERKSLSIFSIQGARPLTHGLEQIGRGSDWTMTASPPAAAAAASEDRHRQTSMMNSSVRTLLFILLVVFPVSVRSQATTQLLPTCPSAGTGCEFDPINRFKCGPLFLCTYDTLCAVGNAGFNQNTDCCQAPTNAACTSM